jgi:putative phage-type endonuclease
MTAPHQPTAPDRRKFLGGSDIAAILGISPWKTAADLWIDKTTPPREDGRNAAAKSRGTRLEPYIVDMVKEEHGLVVAARGQRYIDREVPFFACEIDVEFIAGSGDLDNGEIKTVHPFKAKEWGEEGGDELPIHYVAQTQWGLGITGRDRCHVFALIGDDLKRYLVERDDETIAAMRSRAEAFWRDFVLTGKRPPLDFADSKTLSTLRKLYPGTDGTAIEATAMHEHWRAVLKTAEDMRDKYQGVIDGARAHLLAEMGASARLLFSDGKEYRRKLITKKAQVIEYPATSYMDFRLTNTKETAQ